MSRIGEDFRVRVATAGATSVGGNVDFTIDSVGTDTDGWLRERGLERWGGQEIQPLEGKVISLSWTVLVGESQSGEEFVPNISDADGRADLLKRLIDVSRSTDGGTTWTVQATARIADVEMSAPGQWALRVVDERLIERETEVFGDTSTTAVWPMGPREAWSDIQRSTLIGFNVTQVQADTVVLEPFGSVDAPDSRSGETLHRPAEELTQPIKQAIIDDLREGIDPAETGTVSFDPPPFETLKVDVFPEGSDPDDLSQRVETTTGSKTTEIATHADIVTKGGTDVGITTETGRVTFEDIILLWDINQPSVGDNYFMRLWFEGHDTTNVVPRHIGGTGTHAVQVARDLLTDAGARVDTSAFDGLIADKEIPEVAFRETRPQNLAVWLERHIWQPFGILPLVNAAGEISPQRVYQTTADEVPDVTTLTVLDDSVMVEAPQWNNQTDKQVTRLEYEWESLSDFRTVGDESADPPGGMGADALTVDEKTETRDHDKLSDFGTKSRRISLAGIHSKDRAAHIADGMSKRIFNRFGDGAILTEQVAALSAAADESAGGYVVVDTDIYPDAQSGSYTGARLMQVASKQFTRQPGRGSVLLDLLDAGPKTQPLAKPTVTATQSSSNPTSEIDVDVTNLPTGAGFILQLAKNATEPATDSDLWEDAAALSGAQVASGGSSVTIRNLASGSTYWFRARSVKEGRISSLWSDADSASTAAISAPTGLSFSEVSGCSFVATWSTGVSDRPVKVSVSGGVVDFATHLKEGTTRFEVHDGFVGLAVSTTYTVTVSHPDSFGGEASVSADVTTTATPDTGPDPLAISVLVGRDIQ